MPFFVTPNGHWLFIGRGKSDDRILTAVEKQRYDTLIMATTLAQVNELEPRIGKGLNANTKRVLLNNLPDQRAEAKYVIDRLDADDVGTLWLLVNRFAWSYWKVHEASIARRAPRLRLRFL